MKAVYDSCTSAGIEVPSDVEDFFGGEDPTGMPGLEINLEGLACITQWSDDYRQGYELDVSKLPNGLSVIRFYNSF